jgi:hypothetical protein
LIAAFLMFAMATAQPAAPSEQPELAMATPRANAEAFQTGTALMEKCTGPSVHGLEYCFAYIAAVADTVRAYQVWLDLADVCLPAKLSQRQMSDIVVSYLAANPAQGKQQAASVVVLALAAKYPCKKPTP